jgi:WhiB family redox-sensing transcriptional regulator
MLPTPDHPAPTYPAPYNQDDATDAGQLDPAGTFTTTGDWRSGARCRGADPQLFFAVQPQMVARAKQLCRECDVRSQCLHHALSCEFDGIWGGRTADERRDNVIDIRS